MQATDYDEFARGIAKLMLHADKRLSEARIELYWDRLSDVPIRTFEAAIPILIEQLNGFPKVPQIRKACDEAERRRQWRADQYVPDVDREGPFCVVCNDTGWVPGVTWAESYRAEVPCVRICACRAGNPVYRAKLGQAANALKPEGKYAGTLFTVRSD